MADLANVYMFFKNADAYSAFLHRVAAACVEKALALREEDAPSPVTAEWVARQNWAVGALSGARGAEAAAKAMLPLLAVKANDAGLLDEEGNLEATDTQIRGILTDEWIDVVASYVPEAA